MAEEVGTTPDGNVIYHFKCPGGFTIQNTAKLNWPNHISDHPEFDVVGGGSTKFSKPAVGKKTHFGVRRSGQVLTCEYRIEDGFFNPGPRVYKYEVKRDIISCKNVGSNNDTLECILRPRGEGGKSSSSATSSSPTSSGAGTSLGVESGCCTILANPGLKGRFGRLVMAFPAGAVLTGTRVAVFKEGNEVQADYGSHSWELLSGTYDVTISGKKISNVTVKAGHDTHVKVGVLRITAAKNMRAAVLEGGQEIAGAYGGELIGLPAGSFDVQMAGQTEKVTIIEGKITDF